MAQDRFCSTCRKKLRRGDDAVYYDGEIFCSAYCSHEYEVAVHGELLLED